MSKIEEVRSAMVSAMKAGDKETKESLSLLLSALKNKAIDKKSDLTPEEETHRGMPEADRSAGTVCTEDDVRRRDTHSGKRSAGSTRVRGAGCKRQRKDHERTDAESKGKSRRKACQ